jgi:hypothetical protein
MSVLVKDPNRPTITLRQVTRHSWGPDRTRVVVVAVVQEGDRRTARAFGVQDGRAVEVDRMEGAVLRREGKLRVLVTENSEGSRWELRSVGCSCNVPRQLKGLNPLGVPSS